MDEDEIERARKVHSSVPEWLKTSPIILRNPDKQIFHTATPEMTLTGIHENSEIRDIEMDFKKQWFIGGDHELLKEILKSGIIPLAWREPWPPNKPRTLQNALLVAKNRGYAIPDKFIQTRDVISYSESEAFNAAYGLVSGKYIFWRDDTYLGDRWKIKAEWDRRRSSVYQLTSQFIIPDPLDKIKTPYFLDQLWIYVNSEQQVRLIGLEIDGEPHLEGHSPKKSAARDASLVTMGYEIYHVAGWWCRVDPYKVICEFLNASGIFPNAQVYILGHEYQSISDYKCQICHEPMVRWDIDWIQETERYNEYLLVHKKCIQSISEESY